MRNSYNSKLKDRQEFIRKIEIILGKFGESKVPLSSSLMACQEIFAELKEKDRVDWIKSQFREIGKQKDNVTNMEYRPTVEVKRKRGYFLGSEITLLEYELQRLQGELPKAKSRTPLDVGFGEKWKEEILCDITNILRTLNWIKQTVHAWLIEEIIEIKAGYLPESIFIETQQFVDSKIKRISTEIAERFAAIYDDLSSSNQVKWASAILSCREILRGLANKFNPDSGINQPKGDHKLGPEEYKNRLIDFVKQKSTSEKYWKIFGSTLQNFTDRLEAIYAASCKGKFMCKNKEEAKRHVIYTYMLVADILRLTN